MPFQLVGSPFLFWRVVSKCSDASCFPEDAHRKHLEPVFILTNRFEWFGSFLHLNNPDGW